MVKMTVTYQGEKHCEVLHGPSNSQIATDAPKDNNGKGEAFSPTDLVGAATGSCILTIMAMAAEKEGLDFTGAQVSVEKEMTTHPRRIGKLTIALHLPATVPVSSRKNLEQIGLNCPVKLSLHPDVQLPIVFHYDR